MIPFRVFLLASFILIASLSRAGGEISLSVRSASDVTITWLRQDYISTIYDGHVSAPGQKVMIDDSVLLPAVLSIRLGGRSGDFVLTDAEAHTLRIADDGELITLPGSTENKAFQAFLQIFRPQDDSLARCFRFAPSEVDPAYLGQLSANDARITALVQATNADYETIRKQYPGTYAAAVCDMLTFTLRSRSDKNYDNQRAYLFEHYFDQIHRAKPARGGPYFTLYLKRYFNLITPKKKDALRRAVEIAHTAAKSDPVISDKIFDFLIRNYERSHELAMIKYTQEIFGKEIKMPQGGMMDPNVRPAPGLEQSMAKPKSAPPIAGDVESTVADIYLPDQNNDKIRLSEVATRSKQTVIIFWSADCDHCLQQLPVYYAQSSKLVASGISTYAVAVNSDMPTWRKVIQNFPEYVYQVFAGTDNSFFNSYMIKSTPLFVIVDKQMKVVARYESVVELLSGVE